MRKRRKPPIPKRGNDQRPYPSHHDCANGPHPLCGSAGAEFTELIARPDERAVHRTDTPSHRIRRIELNQRVPDNDTHHVGTATHRQRKKRQQEIVRQAEDDNRYSIDSY